MKTIPNPLAGLRGAFTEQGLTYLRDALGCVWKVQNSYGLGKVVIGKDLEPFGSIHYGCHLRAVLQSPALDFHQT